MRLLHVGARRQTLLNGSDVRLPLIDSEAFRIQLLGRDRDPLRVEADVHVGRVAQGPDEERGPDEQDDGGGALTDHQDIARAPSTGPRPTGLVLQPADQVRA